MLVIAPIVLLMISGFIVLMVSMIGNVLATRDQNAMSYESQDALNRIEQDTRLSIQFLSTTGSVPSPQGSNSNFTGTAAFTNTTNTLILGQLATTRSPATANRQLVYYANQPNPCGSTQTANQLFGLTVVYFIKDGSLWRRSIVPQKNTSKNDANTICGASMWQRNSCSPGYTASRCEINDSEVMKNIDRMTVQYLSAPNGAVLTAANASNATTIKVTLEGKKNTAGRDISTMQIAIAAKINDAPTNVGPTPLAISQNPLDQTVMPTAKNVKFVASPNYSNATLQWQQSTNGGSTWSNISGATSSTLNIATVSLGMNNYRYRLVATDSGVTAISSSATMSVTIWMDVPLLEGWSSYAPATFNDAGYTITSTGEVYLKGMISGGNNTHDTIIAVLPQEAWPSQRLIFYVGTYNTAVTGNSGYGRVDVLTNGEVHIQSISSTWFSLDNISYMPSGACTFTNLTLQNSWTNYGTGWPTLSSCKDSVSRVHVQGLVKPGTTTAGLAIGLFPAGSQPAQNYIVPGGSSGSTAVFGSFGTYTNGIVARGATSNNGFVSVMHTFFPSSYTTWSNLTLTGGWVNYGAGFSTAQYTKSSDNIVTVKGMIKSGTITNGTVVGTLPAGYRPAKKLLLSGVSYDNHVRIDVGPDGAITLQGNANSNWVSLDNITFYAEQ